ncbi:MAG: DUF3187 family protein, partial [Gemmatimonadota bacterium]
WQTDIWLGYANFFEQDSTANDILFLDAERLLTVATVRYGVSPSVEVGGRVTLETDWGGFLDGFMVKFHRVLGLGTRNRPRFPESQVRQTLKDGDGTVLVDIPSANPAVTEARLFVTWRPWRASDGSGAFSLRSVVRIPTRTLTVGSERTDVGLMALGRARWRGWYVHGMAGGATVRRDASMAHLLRDRKWFAMAGLERPLRPGLSGVVELTGETSILHDRNDHDVDGAPTNLVVGLVGRTSGGWRWQVGMQEDVPPKGPSLDFTLQLALSRRW